MNRIKYILVFFIILFLYPFQAYSQETKIIDNPKVDQRVETLSIVFRLAGYEEYCSIRFKSYADSIENYFHPHKNHELINFIKELRKKNGLGYDAVMAMAIHIGNPPEFHPLVKFSTKVPDKRWGKRNAEKFIILLRQFYLDSNCQQFFEKNQQLYNNVNTSFYEIFSHLDINWYEKFYGKAPNEKFKIINGLSNGGGNYGVNITYPNGNRDLYAIMGTWKVNDIGMPEFPFDEYFPILIHEFNHSFVNQLTEQYSNQLKNSGTKIFEVVRNDMINQAYDNWKTMLNEAMVRAAVIKYMKDHTFSEQQINNEVKSQINKGFIWISKLVEELEYYDLHRDIYPTLESYMPNIISAYKNYVDNIDKLDQIILHKRPQLLYIKECNENQFINYKLETLTFVFDKPIYTNTNQLKAIGQKPPYFTNIEYLEGNTQIRVKVQLKKGKKYRFTLPGNQLKSIEKIPMKDINIEFRT